MSFPPFSVIFGEYTNKSRARLSGTRSDAEVTMNTKRLKDYLDSLPAAGLPSFDCSVMQNHREIFRHMGGFVDAGRTVPVSADARYLMFSMTKLQTMVCVMQLVEQGKLSLDDEVSRYLPAFADILVKEEKDGVIRLVPPRTPLTLRHLVSMQSGLDYDLNRPGVAHVLAERGSLATTRELVDAMAQSPLAFHPGEHYMYSLSHDVAAAIVEVVSGKKFSEYLTENIWNPLEMKATRFAKPMNEGYPGLAQQFCCDDGDIAHIRPMEASCNYQLSEAYESGGAGLISCTEDYALFADALACGGVGRNGNRILREETVREFRTNLLSDALRKEIADNMGRLGYGYGIGMQVLMEPELLGTKAPAGIFGWDGAAGSLAIMDTDNKLSLVFTMHVRNCGYAYGVIHPTLRDLLYED